MNKKRVRQMSASLLRRLTTQPAVRYMAPHRAMLAELLEDQAYLQRFAPLYDKGRLQCAGILALCREELDRLSPEPEEGWLAFAYDFARKSMFPEPDFESRREKHGAGAVFFLSLLQVLFDTERDKLPFDPMSDLELLEEGDELSLCRHLESGRELYILTEYLRRDGEKLWCEDSTDYRLPVQPGDRLRVVRKIRNGALCKKEGVTGWYFGRLAST